MDKPPIGPVLQSYDWDGTARGYGSWSTTRCPFHDDRTPSARVNLEDGFFRCFVCEISGDAYDVVMWREGITFPEAKERVKGLTGYDLDNDSGHGRGHMGGGHPGNRLDQPRKITSSKLPAWAKAKTAGRKLV